MLKIDVQKQLGNVNLQIKLDIPSHGITALFGLSGSGKSSLINLVSGLLTPDQGYISLNDRLLFDQRRRINLTPDQRHIGYVFQDARLFPHYHVQGNLRYGMKNVSKEEFSYIVELLGIGHLLKRYPNTLSGGEKQRVAIGRALLTDPEILLMDEPLSALDIPRKQELLRYLEKLSQEINIPILYVTHNLEELVRLAKRVVLIEDGKVKAYDQLENLWQSSLLTPWRGEEERSVLLSLPVSFHNPVYHISAVSLGEQQLWTNAVNAHYGQFLRICIQSSDVSVALKSPEYTSIHNILLGKVSQFMLEKDYVDVKLDVEGYFIWSRITRWAYNDLKLQLGQQVYAQIKKAIVV